MFADIDDFVDAAEKRGEEILDENIVLEEAWKLPSGGGKFGFVIENDIQPVEMQVWKDGKINCLQ